MSAASPPPKRYLARRSICCRAPVDHPFGPPSGPIATTVTAFLMLRCTKCHRHSEHHQLVETTRYGRDLGQPPAWRSDDPDERIEDSPPPPDQPDGDFTPPSPLPVHLPRRILKSIR